MGALRFDTSINLSGCEIQNMSLEKLSAHPENPENGRTYWNTKDLCQYTYDGSDGVWISAQGKGQNAYNYIKQLKDYLFETQYSTENIDQEFCYKYFMTPVSADDSDVLASGHCTGVYNKGEVLRHFDWYYDNEVEFIVRRPSDKEAKKYGSIGVAAALPSLVKSFVKAGTYSEKYRLVPFSMCDGVNEMGLFIQQNVVPRKDNDINITHTHTDYRGEITVNMITRIILDNCKKVSEVETELSKYDIRRSVRMPEQYDSHFLVADGNGGHAIIEFTQDGTSFNVKSFAGTVDGEILSNFSTEGAGSITEGTFALDWNAISDNSGHNAGLERWEIAAAYLQAPTNLEDLRKQLKYTKMYDATLNPQWYTEVDGDNVELTPALAKQAHDGDAEAKAKFEAVLTTSRQDYANRSRSTTGEHSTWQTVHSAIYDLKALTLKLAIQERFDDIMTMYFNDKEVGTSEVALSNPTSESVSGTATTQMAVNTENKTSINQHTIDISTNKADILKRLEKEMVDKRTLVYTTDGKLKASCDAAYFGTDSVILNGTGYISSGHTGQSWTLPNGRKFYPGEVVTIAYYIQDKNGDLRGTVNKTVNANGIIPAFNVGNGWRTYTIATSNIGITQYLSSGTIWDQVGRTTTCKITAKFDFNPIKAVCIPVDRTTLGVNQGDGYIYVLDKGITFEKFASTAITQTIDKTSPSTAKVATEKAVADAVNNIAMGRIVSLWDCSAGKPSPNPSEVPFTYKNGDYYIVKAVAPEGGVNYMPDGSVYTGAVSTKVETGEIHIGDFYHYNGSEWAALINGDTLKVDETTIKKDSNNVISTSIGGSIIETPDTTILLNSKSTAEVAVSPVSLGNTQNDVALGDTLNVDIQLPSDNITETVNVAEDASGRFILLDSSKYKCYFESGELNMYKQFPSGDYAITLSIVDASGGEMEILQYIQTIESNTTNPIDLGSYIGSTIHEGDRIKVSMNYPSYVIDVYTVASKDGVLYIEFEDFVIKFSGKKCTFYRTFESGTYSSNIIRPGGTTVNPIDMRVIKVDNETIILDDQNRLKTNIEQKSPDNKTIVYNDDAKLSTAIGGWKGDASADILEYKNALETAQTTPINLGAGLSAVVLNEEVNVKIESPRGNLEGRFFVEEKDSEATIDISQVMSNTMIKYDSSEYRIIDTAGGSFTEGLYDVKISRNSFIAYHTIDSSYIAKTDNVSLTDASSNVLLTEKGAALNFTKKVTELPEASSELLGVILQYIGESTSEVSKGVFYECTESGGTYSWTPLQNSVKIDNETIVENADGEIKTSIGGYIKTFPRTELLDYNHTETIAVAYIELGDMSENVYDGDNVHLTYSHDGININENKTVHSETIREKEKLCIEVIDNLRVSFNNLSAYLENTDGSSIEAGEYSVHLEKGADDEIGKIDMRALEIDNTTIYLEGNTLKANAGSSAIDEKTIVRDESGNIKTSIGGYISEGTPASILDFNRTFTENAPNPLDLGATSELPSVGDRIYVSVSSPAISVNEYKEVTDRGKLCVELDDENRYAIFFTEDKTTLADNNGGKFPAGEYTVSLSKGAVDIGKIDMRVLDIDPNTLELDGSTLKVKSSTSVDASTIILTPDGKIRTSIGGYVKEGVMDVVSYNSTLEMSTPSINLGETQQTVQVGDELTVELDTPGASFSGTKTVVEKTVTIGDRICLDFDTNVILSFIDGIAYIEHTEGEDLGTGEYNIYLGKQGESIGYIDMRVLDIDPNTLELDGSTLKVKDSSASVSIDEKTIVRDSSGNIRTSIGGYVTNDSYQAFVTMDETMMEQQTPKIVGSTEPKVITPGETIYVEVTSPIMNIDEEQEILSGTNPYIDLGSGYIISFNGGNAVLESESGSPMPIPEGYYRIVLSEKVEEIGKIDMRVLDIDASTLELDGSTLKVKSDLVTRIDEKTIIKAENGKIKTAIGGYVIDPVSETLINYSGESSESSKSLDMGTLRGHVNVGDNLYIDASAPTFSVKETKTVGEREGKSGLCPCLDINDEFAVYFEGGSAYIKRIDGDSLPDGRYVAEIKRETAGDIEYIDMRALNIDTSTLELDKNKLKVKESGVVRSDEKTILKDASGNIYTAVGGWLEETEPNTLEYNVSSETETASPMVLGSGKKAIAAGNKVKVYIKSPIGSTNGEYTVKNVSSVLTIDVSADIQNTVLRYVDSSYLLVKTDDSSFGEGVYDIRISSNDLFVYHKIDNKYIDSVDNVSLLSPSDKILTEAVAAKEFAYKSTTLPTASVDYNGMVIQYTGADTTTLKKGAFYVCALSGTTYKWNIIDATDIDNRTIVKGTDGKLYISCGASYKSGDTVILNSTSYISSGRTWCAWTLPGNRKFFPGETITITYYIQDFFGNINGTVNKTIGVNGTIPSFNHGNGVNTYKIEFTDSGLSYSLASGAIYDRDQHPTSCKITAKFDYNAIQSVCIPVDFTTLGINRTNNNIYVLDKGLTVNKMADTAIAKSISKTGAVDTKLATEKAVSDAISNIAMGRIVSLWDCSTGKPSPNPSEVPFTYKNGDYYIVKTIAPEGGVNYMPDGSVYYDGSVSTKIETGNIHIGDFYHYNGSAWSALINGDALKVDDLTIVKDGNNVISTSAGGYVKNTPAKQIISHTETPIDNVYPISLGTMANPVSVGNELDFVMTTPSGTISDSAIVEENAVGKYLPIDSSQYRVCFDNTDTKFYKMFTSGDYTVTLYKVDSSASQTKILEYTNTLLNSYEPLDLGVYTGTVSEGDTIRTSIVGPSYFIDNELTVEVKVGVKCVNIDDYRISFVGDSAKLSITHATGEYITSISKKAGVEIGKMDMRVMDIDTETLRVTDEGKLSAIAQSQVETDDKTITKNELGKIQTAIGGWREDVSANTLIFHQIYDASAPCPILLGTGLAAIASGDVINVKMTSPLGNVESEYTVQTVGTDLVIDFSTSADGAKIVYADSSYALTKDGSTSFPSGLYDIKLSSQSLYEYHKVDTNYIETANGVSIKNPSETALVTEKDAVKYLGYSSSVMPSADASTLGMVVQYTGESTATLKKGRYYECVKNGTAYKWSYLNIADTDERSILKDASGNLYASCGAAYLNKNTRILTGETYFSGGKKDHQWTLPNGRYFIPGETLSVYIRCDVWSIGSRTATVTVKADGTCDPISISRFGDSATFKLTKNIVYTYYSGSEIYSAGTVQCFIDAKFDVSRIKSQCIPVDFSTLSTNVSTGTIFVQDKGITFAKLANDAVAQTISASSPSTTKVVTEKAVVDAMSSASGSGAIVSFWDCSEGKPSPEPTTIPYTYKNNEYYIVKTVADKGKKNFIPDGSVYNKTASTKIADASVTAGDVFRFDKGVWEHLSVRTKVDTKSIIINEDGAVSANVIDLPESEYQEMKEAGTLDENAVYRTPENKQAYFGLNEMFDLIYPVGSVYVSMNDAIPTGFLGTWERLPDDYYLVSASANQGTELDAELPNIKGSTDNYGDFTIAAPATKGTGAFVLGDDVTSFRLPAAGDGATTKYLTFDANKSNSIYKDGGKVQPKSIQCSMWKRTA